MLNSNLSTYRRMGDELFKSVGQSIGIHVLLLVIEHAIWQTKKQSEEADLITFSDDGLNFDGLDQIPPEKAEEVAHEFIMAIITTLSNLIGLQLANQLTEQLHYIRGENLR